MPPKARKQESGEGETVSEVDSEEDGVTMFRLKLQLKKLEIEGIERDAQLKKEGIERDAQLKKEVMEREAQLKKEDREHEFALAQKRAEMTQSLPSQGRGEFKAERIKVPRLDDGCDPEAIFATFERMCRIYDVPEDEWAAQILPNLHGKALRAYSKIAEGNARNYPMIKAEILKAFQLTPEEHRKNFRGAKKRDNESYTQFLTRMRDSFEAWIKGEEIGENTEKLKDLLVKEQYLRIVPLDMKVWLLDRAPTGPEEYALLSDRYIESRVNKMEVKKERYPNRSAQEMYRQANKDKLQTKSEAWHQRQPEGNVRHNVTCFTCGQRGHYSSTCTVSNTKRDSNGTLPKKMYFLATMEQGFPKKYGRQMIVNNQKVEAYRDTGAFISLVRNDLIRKNQLTGKTVCLATIAGDEEEVPTAVVNWHIDGKDEPVEVAVLKKLPIPVIIGNDVGELLRATITLEKYISEGENGKKIDGRCGKLYEQNVLIDGKCVSALRDTGSDLTIVRSACLRPGQYTRKLKSVQSITGKKIKLPMAQIDLEDRWGRRQMEVGVSDIIPYHVLIGNDCGAEMNPISDCFVVTRRMAKDTQRLTEIPHLEDSGSRNVLNEALVHGEAVPKRNKEIAKDSDGVLPDQMREHWDSINQKLLSVEGKEEFRKLQREDATFKEIYKKMKEEKNIGEKEGTAEFQLKDEILIRRWRSLKQDQTYEQLVVPKGLREPLMYTAHETLLAGHLGVKKSRDRLMAHFYWPGIFTDIANYVGSCPSCQKTRRSEVGLKAPLQPVPVITEVFWKVGVDLVGPLPVTESGNKYILTMVDYASKYPEAEPLATMEAETVVESLIKMFTRVGFPHEIVTDQGRQFMAQITQGLWHRTGVKINRTTPYHPQGNGQTEKFNGTLKHMLRTLAEQHQEDWDVLMPYALFAYREVPNECTGFSPFELLYGHNVRGPMEVLKKTWTEQADEKRPVTTYLKELRTKMLKTANLAAKHATEAKDRQKRWYDRNARKRQFCVGQKVMVLRPVKGEALEVAWDGPYQVTRKISDLNYEVEIDDVVGIKKIYHVNMLKSFLDRIPIVGMTVATELLDVVEDSRHALPTSEVIHSEPTLGKSLTEDQKNDILKILERHPQVLNELPGTTSMEKHGIELSSSTPICSKQYRNPWAVRQEIEKQVLEMLNMGIIEESRSKYASPVVLVKKKTGPPRFCIDFRLINSKSKADAYPAPNLEDALAGLSEVKYMTKIDLVRGYWQIPMEESSKEMTAFRTESGLYHFNVMPFGLKNSSATFMRLMDRVLRGLGNFTKCYIDDVLIFSSDWKSHLSHISTVLGRLEEAGLTAKPSKCSFGVDSVDYLGHRVGPQGISPEEAKVEAIKNWPRPNTKKQVRAFLGITGYYRKYIPLYSDIAVPLTDLIKKSLPTKVKWNEACTVAFETLKERLSTKPVLASPHYKDKFVLQTDASDRGLGAVLSQISTASGEERPIAYLSRKLNATEQAYSTIEKEGLCIVWAIEKVRPYVYGKVFTVVTDHNPLTWMHQMKDRNRKILRWVLMLQEYDFDINYKQGNKHSNADGLSRKD